MWFFAWILGLTLACAFAVSTGYLLDNPKKG